VYIHGVAECEMRGRRQLKPDPAARSITRAADRSAAWPNPRHVKNKHRTDRINIHIFEERVERTTSKSHVVIRFLLRLRLVDLTKLRSQSFPCRLNSSRRRSQRFVLQRAIQITLAR